MPRPRRASFYACSDAEDIHDEYCECRSRRHHSKNCDCQFRLSVSFNVLHSQNCPFDYESDYTSFVSDENDAEDEDYYTEDW